MQIYLQCFTPVVFSLTVKIFDTFGWIKIKCTFFSHTAIVPVHENLILIAYAGIPKIISIILPLMAKMFSDIFSLHVAI